MLVFCRDKTMQIFLSRQKFCQDKRNFVATTILSRLKMCFVADAKDFVSEKKRTNFCYDIICREKRFVAASILLSWQKDVFCRDKHVFVVTKIIRVAAPANDTNPAPKQMAPQFMRDYVKHVGLAHVFVATKLVTWQAYFCHFKRLVLSRQTRVCREKSKLVTTKVLARQKCVAKVWSTSRTNPFPLFIGKEIAGMAAPQGVEIVVLIVTEPSNDLSMQMKTGTQFLRFSDQLPSLLRVPFICAWLTSCIY